jgi:hypothetical protein
MEGFFSAEDTRTREEREELRKRALSALTAVVGEKWVTNDPLILDTYAWQYIAEFASGTNYIGRPLAVVLPANREEISGIIRVCRDLGCQYKALSTGFGFWAGVMKDDFVVQIDLRRMDRIIDIDKKNMIAVIEPYVTGGQLQTEAMKKGLNTHIAGVGAQASVLASATSVMGQGWDGISLGFSDRNLLGVEWVMPDGHIAQLGSFDASGAYFSGDGPGFSLRGVMRGFAGALGGLGVFTKCAVKLYPWYGPEKLSITGTSPNYWADILDHHMAGIIIVDGWDKMAELGYALAEAEILDLVGRNAPSLISGVLSVDNNEFADIYKIPLFHEMYYTFMFVIIGRDKEDLKYRVKTLKAIVKQLGGGLMLPGMSLDKLYWQTKGLAAVAKRSGSGAVLKSIPGFLKLIWRDIKLYGLKGADYLPNMVYSTMLRSHLNAIRGAKVGEQIKRRFIEKKIIFDDGADNAWGGLYEGGAYSHLEELAMYDPRDEYCRERVIDFLVETNLACIDHVCGDPINAIGPPNHLIFSPACMNYDDWQQKIKATLDPDNLSDPFMYTDPEFAKNPPASTQNAFERVMKERVKIEIDD